MNLLNHLRFPHPHLWISSFIDRTANLWEQLWSCNRKLDGVSKNPTSFHAEAPLSTANPEVMTMEDIGFDKRRRGQLGGTLRL